MSRFSFGGSRAGARPVDFYRFDLGSDESDYLAYTSAEQAHTVDGLLYEPLAIDRDAVQSRGRGQSGELKVELPASSEIATLFRGGAPRRVVFLRIYEGNIPDARDLAGTSEPVEVNLVWSGRVLEATRKDSQTTLACDSLGAGMARPALTRNYQRECPLVLYGDRCNASKLLATFATTVDAVSGREVTVPSGWNGAQHPAYFIGGLLEWDGDTGAETRQIVNASDTSITVDTTLTELEAGDSVDAILGCPRSMDACTTLHGNILNYGGTPFIPLTNPVNQNNHT
ncbi:phage BR0599 family protein [Shimia sp.]|uniref:phage BR0599 family protein n=1 Tax=Shimia sp. TaxID=1954381 RepID=UPI003299D523